MPVRGVLTTKGLERWLEDLAAAGANVDQAVDDALASGAKVAQEEMIRRAPELSGNLKGAIVVGAVKREGNYHSVEIGLLDADKDTARYGNAQEFGTSSMAAHPYIRPAIDEGKGAIMRAMRDSLKGSGTI